ncbi:MAG: hypothetical protein HYZ47_05530, partial [Simkania negevensis]|nr:hypothetical protein [Simkania negevensis]
MSLISKIYSGSYSALSYVGSSIKSGMSKSYAVGCKAVEKIGKVFLAIKQGREALRQPNVTICTKISQGLQGVKLGQLLAVPLTSQPKAMSFFDKFQSKQTSWLIRLILGKAKTTPLTQEQAQFIAPKIGSAITEKNVQNVTGALLSATQGMAKAVAIIGAAPDVAQMKSDLLTHFNEPGKSAIDFEQEKQRVRKQVHSNICTLLALKKEETPFFSLDYLAILGAYIAVKWFNMDLDALASAYEMAIGEIGDSSELINKFKEGGEFVVLKLL